MNILIIEDDPAVARFIQNILRKLDMVHIVKTAHSFNDGYQKAMSGVFDVILLDIFLKQDKFTGIELCASIRKSNEQVPIIMITASTSVLSLEQAFLSGANDYITKPFKPKELELRIQRWVSYSGHTKLVKQLEYKELSYDLNFHELSFKGQRIPLGKKSKTLLLLFLKAPEEILSSDYLRKKIWGDIDFAKQRNIRSNIQLLRTALEKYGINWIHTHRGEGYSLKKPDIREVVKEIL